MSVLDKICADKKDHVEAKKAQKLQSDLKKIIEDQPATLSFIKALKNSGQNHAIIAEVKKASPSKGIIRDNFNAVDIAKIYEANGAACLSVLTDEPYFQGHDDYLIAVKDAVSIPVLRKDFMIDPYQIYESRALGADCILLIMAYLDDTLAEELYDLANELGMDSLFEVHDEEELERALALNPKILGVNNRNLKTLDVSLDTGLSLAKRIPDTVLKVGESGLNSKSDLQRFSQAGFDAFLIGESLMKQDNIGAALSSLIK
ncbi:MAG: indole-3-glycerol phosphate synthase TrpC [Pseudomonadota bacterium]